MTLLRLSLLFVFLSRTTNVVWAHRNHSDLIPEWFPTCFEEGSTLVDMFGCLEDNVLNGTCFADYGLSDVVGCMVDHLEDARSASENNVGGFVGLLIQLGQFINSFFNATRVCLDPLADCAFDTIVEKIEELELTCINETLSDLNQCAKDNGGDCKESCNGTLPETNPFSKNLQLSDLETCNGIQTEIVDPSCEIIDCCEPCVDPFNRAMECLVNKVLNHTTDPVPCGFTCPETSRGRALFDKATTAYEPGRFLADHEDESDNPLVSQCLQFAPGLTGQNAQELQARSEFYMPCLWENYVDVIEKQEPKAGDDDDDDDDDDGKKESKKSGVVMFEVSAAVFWFVGVLPAVFAWL